MLFFLSFLMIAGVSNAAEIPRIATAYLLSENVTGSITFTEVDDGLQVSGTIVGLSPGRYGFHIHTLGDISTCDATGSHYDPDGNPHAGPTEEIRHVGDLGNVEFEGEGEEGVATINFIDSVISLRGRNSILGRALVLHEGEDDLGLGDQENSLITGNAGGRVACGVVGIKSPEDPWNAAPGMVPSVLVVLSFVLYLVRI